MRSGTPRPYRKPRPAVLVLCWIALVALTIFLVALVTEEIGSVVHPGSKGTAVVTHCATRGTNTRCYGDFCSAGGTIVWHDTRIWGEDGAHTGQRFTAHADTSRHEVNVGDSAQNIYFDILVPLIGLGWWVFLFRLCIWKPLRYRRARNSSASRV